MLRKKEFDPLEYIENAFLDTESAEANPDMQSVPSGGQLDIDLPRFTDYIGGDSASSPDDGRPLEVGPNGHANGVAEPHLANGKASSRFRRTEMSAPRPRRARSHNAQPTVDPEIRRLWEKLPRNIEFLMGFFDDSVTAKYYTGDFKESREDLIRRLLDPELSLEETSRLLGVCPATVRRYTNRKWLTHHRTPGGQRRFRLSDIVRFVETHGRLPEED
ncbi:MAG: helix-turn-helix domain-containing protein [Fimbriimonadaceae bacterium]